MKAERSITNPRLIDRVRDEAGLIGQAILRSLSPASLWGGLKTLAWLGPLTLLIWLYAAQGQTKTLPNQTISIAIRSNNPNISVQLLQADSNVVAELSGPAGLLDEVQRKIQPTDTYTPVQLTMPELPPDGVHELDPSVLLRANPIFRNVQIKDCRPDRIKVFVDSIDEKVIEVQKPEALKNIDVTLFEPASVRVRAPSEVFKKTNKLEALLTTSAKLNSKGEQTEQLVAVKLADLQSDQYLSLIKYDPPSVKATFTVKEYAESTFTYRSIPIVTLGPPIVLNKFTIEFENDKDTLSNVTVRGPADKIAALKQIADTHPDELIKPRAILEIAPEDRQSSGQAFRAQKLRFDHLPDSSIRIDPDSENAVASFRLLDRTASQ